MCVIEFGKKRADSSSGTPTLPTELYDSLMQDRGLSESEVIFFFYVIYPLGAIRIFQ